MHFHVYLDEGLAKNLAQCCQNTHKKRNAVIREALQLYFDQKNDHWPPDLLAFKGIQDFPTLESLRGDFSDDFDRSFLE